MAKTKSILFTKRRPEIKNNISINNQTIEWTPTVTYLGVTMDTKLTFTPHINTVCQKSKSLIVSLFPLLNRASKLSVSNKLLIYLIIVRPMLLYAAPSWSFICKTNILKLQRVQNKFLRFALNAPRYTPLRILHERTDLMYISDVLRGQTQKFIDEVEGHENRLINTIGQYDTQTVYKHKRIKNILL